METKTTHATLLAEAEGLLCLAACPEFAPELDADGRSDPTALAEIIRLANECVRHAHAVKIDALTKLGEHRAAEGQKPARRRGRQV